MFGSHQTDERRAAFFGKLGLDAEAIQQLHASVQQPLLEDRGLPPYLLRFLKDWHAGSAFAAKGAHHRYVPMSGVKPGDPMADMMFNFVFHLFQVGYIAALREAGLLPLVQGAAQGLLGDSLLQEQVEVLPPTFFDDMVVLLEAPTPEGLVSSLSQATSLAIACAAKLGFLVNFRPGKTEAVISLRGRGALALREDLAREVVGDHWGELLLQCSSRLRLVERYVHLGITFAESRAKRSCAEFASRSSAARGTACALTPFFPQ